MNKNETRRIGSSGPDPGFVLGLAISVVVGFAAGVPAYAQGA